MRGGGWEWRRCRVSYVMNVKYPVLMEKNKKKLLSVCRLLNFPRECQTTAVCVVKVNLVDNS